MPTRRLVTAVLTAGVAAVLVPALAACSSSKHGASGESVFDVKPGQCFQAPGKVESELSKLNEIDCGQPHTQQAYAIVGFLNADGSSASAYPGADQLTSFAQGACAQRFTGFVGVDYLDSKLYFTYLLPSARSWEQSDDHNVICFVTTTGAPLTKSVQGTKE